MKICITGPESCGKSTLSTQLAQHLNALHFPEYAREYLEKNCLEYTESDLIEIARGHISRVADSSRPTVYDTALENLMIWQQVKYGRVDPWIKEQFILERIDLYLICYPDLPWTEDPMRENPERRHELFDLYVALLEEFSRPFEIIRGTGDQRINAALSAAENFQ